VTRDLDAAAERKPQDLDSALGNYGCEVPVGEGQDFPWLQGSVSRNRLPCAEVIVTEVMN
jgi:hypothetical protein